MSYYRISTLKSNLITSDTNFDVLRLLINTNRLDRLEELKRKNKISIGSYTKTRKVDIANNKIFFRLTIIKPQFQEIMYKGNILEKMRNRLARTLIVTIICFYIASKLIELLITANVLKFIKV